MHPVKSMLYYIKKHNIKQPVFSLCGGPGNETLRRGGVDVRTLVCIINIHSKELNYALSLLKNHHSYR